VPDENVKKKIGRPKKAVIASNTKRNKVGRPKGEAGIIAEYRARMLSSPKSRKVLDSILTAATSDGHPHQAAAWKLWMDRALPVSAFDTKKGIGEKPSVTINVTGLGGSVSVSPDALEADYEEVDDD
tara:strand:- start:8648 stop:9028 length:381 start_codon:yes stop_codon:yes gene_type:complete